MPYITSTLSSGVNYAIYGTTAGGLPVVKKEIIISGGTGVINKVFATPNGVVTEVTDEELELLEAHPLFRKHKEAGFIKVSKSSKLDTSNMEEKDKSAQLVEKDFTKRGRKAPKVNKK
jgi:hypothetical protein